MIGVFFDPLVVLSASTDPDLRAWAVRELTRAGYSDADLIERDLRVVAGVS